jgi:hypothetical protein
MTTALLQGVLDIPSVQLAPVLRPWSEDDDRLGEILEGRL